MSKKGFTLIEMIIYLSFLVIFLVVIIQASLVMFSSFAASRVSQSLSRTGSLVMERLEREIRQADSIDDLASTFGSHPGRLTLNTTDTLGNITTIEFAVVSNAVTAKVGSGTAESLTSGHTTVSNLIFRKITTANGQAVRVELSLTDDRQTSLTPVKFYLTASLRGMY